MTETDGPELDKAKQRCGDIAFGCTACKSLLGFVDKDTRSKIRIKYRDLYIRITDARLLEITCRSCGEINHLEGGF
jgi:RNase P subunit RPR2